MANRPWRSFSFLFIALVGVLALPGLKSELLAAPKPAPLQRVVTTRVAHLKAGDPEATFRAALWGGTGYVSCSYNFRFAQTKVQIWVDSDDLAPIQVWSPTYRYYGNDYAAVMDVVAIDDAAAFPWVIATQSMRAVRNNRTLRVEAQAAIDGQLDQCDVSYTVEESDNS